MEWQWKYWQDIYRSVKNLVAFSICNIFWPTFSIQLCDNAEVSSNYFKLFILYIQRRKLSQTSFLPLPWRADSRLFEKTKINPNQFHLSVEIEQESRNRTKGLSREVVTPPGMENHIVCRISGISDQSSNKRGGQNVDGGRTKTHVLTWAPVIQILEQQGRIEELV